MKLVRDAARGVHPTHPAASRRRALGPALAIAITALVGGCGGDASFPVTDPREILSKVVDRAIALERVHLDVQLAEAGNFLGGPERASLQADLDVKGGELSLTAKSSEATAAPLRLVIADGSLFTSAGGGWDVTDLGDAVAGGPLAMLPARERIVDVLRAIVADARVGLERRDPVECSVGRCYSVTVTVPAAVLWDHLRPVIGPALGLPDVLPGDVPPVNLLVYANPATFDLVYAEIVYAPSSGRFRLMIDASRHDQPMEIKPPQ
jgi:hypothetical protein